MRFLYLAGMLSMDGLLCTFVLAGLACGHLAMTGEPGRRRWLILSALACALGILTKGPVALLLIGVPLAALAFLDRRSRFATKLEAVGHLGIVALIAGPWFVYMARSAPGAAGDFLWLHHLARYFAPIDHEKPAWFYVPSLLLGMLPWTLLLIPLMPYLLHKSRRAGQRRPAVLGVFVLAFAWCVVFFSLSGCKRPGYILPALPLLALILGTFVTHGLPWRRWLSAVATQWSGHRLARQLGLATLGVGAILSVAAALSQLWTWTAALSAAALFAGGGALIALAPRRLPVWSSWAGCALAACSVLGFAQRAWLPEYHDRFGLRRQVEISSAYEQEEDLPILSYPKRWDSIGFYAKRTDVQVYGPNEFARLVHDLEICRRAIVFIRRDDSFSNLRNALPPHLEAQPLGREADFVMVVQVRPRR
jgi:4-amino-4-deoxy-L-arabinose transferase-like glycosyltransferase